MGGRYAITGTQIGLLKVLLIEGNFNKALRILQEIEHQQFINDSDKDFKEDLQKYRHVPD